MKIKANKWLTSLSGSPLGGFVSGIGLLVVDVVLGEVVDLQWKSLGSRRDFENFF
jgi:hypothetical protein